jgi:hypothetical protein
VVLQQLLAPLGAAPHLLRQSASDAHDAEQLAFPPPAPDEFVPPELAMPDDERLPALPEDAGRAKPPDDDGAWLAPEEDPLPLPPPDVDVLPEDEPAPPSSIQPGAESPQATTKPTQTADSAHALRFVMLVSFALPIKLSSRLSQGPPSHEPTATT